MPSPYSVARDDYHERPKRSDVPTPEPLSRFLYETLSPLIPSTALVFDPSVGEGSLVQPWYHRGHRVVGCDLYDAGVCDRFLQGPFEGIPREGWSEERPGVVLCNPPWGTGGGRLMPEVFLRHLVHLFGDGVPIALITPMGMRLNQRIRSGRYRWLRDEGPRISSILSLPLDLFPGVEFHCEVLFFNVRGLPAHLFLPDWVVDEIVGG